MDFDNFCKKFHKEYKTTEDYNTHLQQFVRNSEKFAKKNAKHTSAHFGTDIGADLSPEEFKSQMLGAVVIEEDGGKAAGGLAQTGSKLADNNGGVDLALEGGIDF